VDSAIVQFGIVGAGRIARNRIAPAMKAARGVRLYAAASREIERAKGLGPVRAYASYGDLMRDPSVDAVFITTHNGLHRELTLEALANGKHVLCEKPLARNASECEEVLIAARAAGRHMVEAFMYRYHPQIDRVQELVGGGAVGEVVSVEASFRFHLGRDHDVRLNPQWGGGSLLDVGCYCVNATRLFLGNEPTYVQGRARFDRPHGVDISFQAILEYASGCSATISCGFDGGLYQKLAVVGTKGSLSLNAPFVARASTPRLTLQSEQGEEVTEMDTVNPYQMEIEDLARAIVNGARPKLTPEEGLLNARVLDRLAADARP